MTSFWIPIAKAIRFPKVIFGNSKSADLLRRILNEYHPEENALATRVQPDKGQALKESFPTPTTIRFPNPSYSNVVNSMTRTLDRHSKPTAVPI